MHELVDREPRGARNQRKEKPNWHSGTAAFLEEKPCIPLLETA
jgi:hypothetical protein